MGEKKTAHASKPYQKTRSNNTTFAGHVLSRRRVGTHCKNVRETKIKKRRERYAARSRETATTIFFIRLRPKFFARYSWYTSGLAVSPVANPQRTNIVIVIHVRAGETFVVTFISTIPERAFVGYSCGASTRNFHVPLYARTAVRSHMCEKRQFFFSLTLPGPLIIPMRSRRDARMLLWSLFEIRSRGTEFPSETACRNAVVRNEPPAPGGERFRARDVIARRVTGTLPITFYFSRTRSRKTKRKPPAKKVERNYDFVNDRDLQKKIFFKNVTPGQTFLFLFRTANMFVRTVVLDPVKHARDTTASSFVHTDRTKSIVTGRPAFRNFITPRKPTSYTYFQ